MSQIDWDYIKKASEKSGAFYAAGNYTVSSEMRRFFKSVLKKHKKLRKIYCENKNIMLWCTRNRANTLLICGGRVFYLFYLSAFKKYSQVSVSGISFFYVCIVKK